MLDNLSQLDGALESFFQSAERLATFGQNEADDTLAFSNKLVEAFGKAVPVLISFAASQLGLSGVPRQIQQAINLVPNTVNSALRSIVSRIASAVGLNPSNGEMFRGKLAPERTFSYNGVTAQILRV